MLYQLTNGKVIELSLDEYLDMSDSDFQNLLGYNIGEHISNPWVGSSLHDESKVEEEEEEKILELPDVDELDKLLDQDCDLEED